LPQLDDQGDPNQAPDSKINQTLKKIQSTQIRADLNLNTGVRYSGI
jgi:molybdopterin-containing oxidoreductase family iron-sulfur binding subunit